MKLNLAHSAFLAVLVAAAATFTSSASAQQNQQGRICVLDVAKVFKENASFQNQMEGIKSEAAKLKNTVEAQFADLQKQAEQLEQYKSDSTERRELERQLVQKQADLQTRARQQEADLLTREARIYLQTYRQMEQVVAGVCESSNIALVLRFESTPINEEDRADVIKGVNRQIVYQKPGDDMTDFVIKSMASGTAQAPSGTQNR